VQSKHEMAAARDLQAVLSCFIVEGDDCHACRTCWACFYVQVYAKPRTGLL